MGPRTDRPRSTGAAPKAITWSAQHVRGDACRWTCGAAARHRPTEIGGGFGGKNDSLSSSLLALALSKESRAARSRSTMSREEVLRATGPTSGAHSMDIKVGMKQGRYASPPAEAELRLSRAAPIAGSPVPSSASMCGVCAATTSRTSRRLAGNVVTVNRPKARRLSRAGGAHGGSIFGVENAILDELCQRARPRPDRGPAQKRIANEGHKRPPTVRRSRKSG